MTIKINVIYFVVCLFSDINSKIAQCLVSSPLSAHLTPESSALRMAESCSLKRGSTLVWIETSCPSASAALSLTARLESCRAFKKVVWS